MKRIINVFLSFVLLISLCACDNSRNVNECIDLINNITSIDTFGVLLPQGEIGYFDKGFKEYETAKAKYDELSDTEKRKVDNAPIF